jgi:hypothetical protein
VNWTGWRVAATAFAVELVWVVGVVVAARYVPALTATPGLEGETGTGPALRAQLLVLTGVVGGVLAGGLLSRLPVGYRWTRIGYSWADVGYYAAVASLLATTVAFGALATVRFLRTWAATGVLAPLVVGVISLVRLGGFVLLAGVGGFFAGAVSFVCANGVAALLAARGS